MQKEFLRIQKLHTMSNWPFIFCK